MERSRCQPVHLAGCLRTGHRSNRAGTIRIQEICPGRRALRNVVTSVTSLITYFRWSIDHGNAGWVNAPFRRPIVAEFRPGTQRNTAHPGTTVHAKKKMPAGSVQSVLNCSRTKKPQTRPVLGQRLERGDNAGGLGIPRGCVRSIDKGPRNLWVMGVGEQGRQRGGDGRKGRRTEGNLTLNIQEVPRQLRQAPMEPPDEPRSESFP